MLHRFLLTTSDGRRWFFRGNKMRALQPHYSSITVLVGNDDFSINEYRLTDVSVYPSKQEIHFHSECPIQPARQFERVVTSNPQVSRIFDLIRRYPGPLLAHNSASVVYTPRVDIDLCSGKIEPFIFIIEDPPDTAVLMKTDTDSLTDSEKDELTHTTD